MESVGKLIRRLLRSETLIWCEQGTVRFRGPKSSIGQSDLESLRVRKKEVVHFLQTSGLTSGAMPLAAAMKRTSSLPTSLTQQRLWFLSQLGMTGTAFHMSGGLRLQGVLDRTALRRALDRIVARHEILRTTFAEVDGEATQVIAAPENGMRLREEDLSRAVDPAERLQALMAQEKEADFDLRAGPLIRACLVRLGEIEHVLLLTMHHIISDGWSISVLSKELSTLYGAYVKGQDDPLPPLVLQFADYVLWQRGWLRGDRLQRQSRYWQDRLAQAPELLELPRDHARPPFQSYAGSSVAVSLDAALASGLQALGRRHEATLFMTLLAGWALLLSRLSGQDEVVIGTPVANRTRAELEGLIGFFVNTLPLRIDISGAPTVAELLSRVRLELLGAQSHADIPFEQVVQQLDPARSLAHSPVFQAVLAWRNIPATGAGVHWPGLELRELPAPITTEQFDLTLFLEPARDGNGIAGRLSYATALFERSTVERYLGYWMKLLQGMVSDDRQAVHGLEMLPETERQRLLVQWNATQASYPRELCVHELFEEQVRRRPDELALVCGSKRLSYLQLSQRADALARALRDRGVRPDSLVGICLGREVSLVVGVLGVLKAGGAWLALDPDYPPQRLLYVLEDAAPHLVLTQPDLSGRLPETSTKVMLLDAQGQLPGETERAVPPSGESPQLARATGLNNSHLAYVIYTSGSTGRPKGVMIEHRNAVNFICWGRAQFTPGELRHTVFAASINFDLSVFELLVPLSGGGTVHLVSNALELKEAASVATLFSAVPSAAAALLVAHQELPALEALNLGGEPLQQSLVEELYRQTPARRILNLYGPSEATTCSTWTTVKRGSPSEPPIGRPIANTQVYILDRHGQPVPTGVVGEIYIGGAGVTRGYLNRPGLTAQRFVPDPYGAGPGARLYRTGDLGRYLQDGNIEFRGRNDDQVKLRGYRIELAEIEARLRGCAGVREAVVLVRGDLPGEKRLVAYVTADAPLPASELRTALGEVLPEYMIPSAFVTLATLPLAPNGKLDRRALPAPEGQDIRVTYEDPQGEIEQALAAIWQTLLHVPRVGRHDNFFELGGHSLLTLSLVAQIRDAFGVTISIASIFASPTVAEVARLIAAKASEPGNIDVPAWLIPLRRGRNSRHAVLFLPTIFGLGSVYAGLARQLKTPADILTCRLPGTALHESPLSSIEDLAAHCLASIIQPEPYREWSLVGWSFGGVLAYELARQITQRGLRLHRTILVDSYLWVPTSDPSPPWAEAGTEFARVFRDPPAGPLEIETLRRIGAINMRALAAYRGGPYSGPLVQLQADATAADIEAGARPQLRAFSDRAEAKIRVPGDHYSILDPGQGAQFARLLDELLAVPAEQ